MIPYKYMQNRFTRKVTICLGMFVVVFFTNITDISSASISEFYIPKSFVFTKDLKLGTSVSPDVYYLQNLLNMNASTTVSLYGYGSNKKLSTYYGEKTKDAVRRFQEVFSSNINYEKSLSTSTATSTFVTSPDTVDVFTRNVLNKLLKIYNEDKEKYIEYLKTGKTIDGNIPRATLEKDLSKKISSSSQKVSGAAIVNAAVAASGVPVAAAVVPTMLNFGGISTTVITCTCSGNLLITVADVRGFPAPLIYQPGATMLYMMYAPIPAVNMLGQYVPGGVCLVYAGTGCVSGGTPIGTMTQLGTSLTIGK